MNAWLPLVVILSLNPGTTTDDGADEEVMEMTGKTVAVLLSVLSLLTTTLARAQTRHADLPRAAQHRPLPRDLGSALGRYAGSSGLRCQHTQRHHHR